MINIGIIGMGQRGRATLERLADIPQAQVLCTCDSQASARPDAPITFYTDWHEAIRHEGIDIFYICTPWDKHVDIALEAMRLGRHVALEVPAAMKVSECQQLVRMSKQTGCYCVMLENCCYDTWHLGVRHIVRQGLLGEVTHLEGAYIHTVAPDWMIDMRRQHLGNPYPTHGLGPMCQLLQEGDSMEFLVSLNADNPVTGDNLNDTLIRTRLGVTMLLQYDVSTPRPYNRLQTVCGTLGFAQKYPLPTIQLCDRLYTGDEAIRFVEDHIPADYQSLIAEGKAKGVKNVMNYMMDRRLINALSQGLPPDTDVHEAALWSCITELTEQSATHDGVRVDIPRL